LSLHQIQDDTSAEGVPRYTFVCFSFVSFFTILMSGLF